MPEVLSEEDFYQTMVAISAKEGLGGAAWVKIKAHDAALRAALVKAEVDFSTANRQIVDLSASNMSVMEISTEHQQRALTSEAALAAIARERALRAALTSVRDSCAMAQRLWMEGDNGEDLFLKSVIDEATASLNAAPSPACPSCERLRGLIDRDRTGLAAALGEVVSTVKGCSWIPDGEWACYGWKERTAQTLRNEVGYAFKSIRETALNALRESGKRADAAFRPDAALAHAEETPYPTGVQIAQCDSCGRSGTPPTCRGCAEFSPPTDGSRCNGWRAPHAEGTHASKEGK